MLLVALGGALGTLARALIVEVAAVGGWAPLATLSVNTSGALLAGFFAAQSLSVRWRALLLSGLLGGFTTFSALAQELAAVGGVHSLGDGAVALALGLAAAGLGWRWGGRFARRRAAS